MDSPDNLSSPNRLRFLKGKQPLAQQVAGVLLENQEQTPVDLRDVEIWVAGRGAERRIRLAMANLAEEQGAGGVLAPRFFQPMRALLPDSPALPLASRMDREAAWGMVLRETSADETDAVFPMREALDDDRALLGVGSLLCDLCDLLAEGGKSLQSPDLLSACEEDRERWTQLSHLYTSYLRLLRKLELSDPNDLRLCEVRNPTPRPGLQKIVIACIPDLPRIAADFADQLTKSGVTVQVLIQAPEGLPAGFDSWGRPLPGEWQDARLPLHQEQIVPYRTSKEEAEGSMDYLAAAQPAGDYSLVLADVAAVPDFQAAIFQRGSRAFDPEGISLMGSEPAVIALEWMRWTSGCNLRDLRRLLECPHFANWIGRRSAAPVTLLLRLCDFFLAEILCETLEQAEAFFPQWQPEKEEELSLRQAAERLFPALRETESLSAGAVVRQAFQGGTGPGNAPANEVLRIWDEVGASPVFDRWKTARRPAFARALQSGVLFTASQPGEVEISGWLEAPWIEAGRMAVCSCSEGLLPSVLQSHPFLPDSKRRALGLADNAARSARDAFLLSTLALVREQENFRCSLSRFAANGNPQLPSSLLLRCGSENLAARVLHLFGETRLSSRRATRGNKWRWNLPESLRRSHRGRISPTDFSVYLRCPFRFYFQRILYLEEFDPRTREMDATHFGSLLHNALEDFANTKPHPTDAREIEKSVLANLDRTALRAFGPAPSPAVRIQIEAARIRLRAFAQIQEREFANGWRILEAEAKLEADAAHPLQIGPLPLSAKLDRVEEHPDHGIRILDYKTFTRAKIPEETHLGTKSAAGPLEAARTEVSGKERWWLDLQLPLYRRVAEHLFPGRPVQIGYFLLPADPTETEVSIFEMDDELYQSALRCAEDCANRVARGNFWPPQPHRAHWDDPFAPLFLNGNPQDCFEPDTIEFLRGKPEPEP